MADPPQSRVRLDPEELAETIVQTVLTRGTLPQKNPNMRIASKDDTDALRRLTGENVFPRWSTSTWSFPIRGRHFISQLALADT